MGLVGQPLEHSSRSRDALDSMVENPGAGQRLTEFTAGFLRWRRFPMLYPMDKGQTRTMVASETVANG